MNGAVLLIAGAGASDCDFNRHSIAVYPFGCVVDGRIITARRKRWLVLAPNITAFDLQEAVIARPTKVPAMAFCFSA